MSPDRTTITRAEAIRRRKEEEQYRSERGSHKSASKQRSASTPKTEARPKTSTSRSNQSSVSPLASSRLRHRYDIAMSVPRGRAQSFGAQKSPALSFSMPRIHYGPRLISFFLVLFCALDIFVMFNMDPFIVRSAQVVGNKRVSVQEVVSASGALNQPAAFINPLQLEHNIRVAFQDFDNVQVEVNLPASVVVTVSERKPLAVWQQDGRSVWVDAKGYAFPARGDLPGLMIINALGAPPPPAPLDPGAAPQIGAQAFLDSDLMQAVATLSANVPQGAALVFDPKYGLGWSDPQGWTVYFGHTNGDTKLKLSVYQAMLEYLGKNNLKPVLISVEYPNAPFYRLEQ